MTRWMERKVNAIHRAGIPIGKGFDFQVRIDTSVHQSFGDRVGQVMHASATGMVAVGMRYDGPIHSTPWVDIHIRYGAVDAFGRERQ